MKTNLTDAEITIMNILWNKSPLRAAEIAEIALKQKDWNKNTTYTLIKRLVNKKAILREEPHFVCSPLIKQNEVRLKKTKSLIDKMYNGSFCNMIRNFVKEENLTEKEIEELKKIISEVSKDE